MISIDNSALTNTTSGIGTNPVNIALVTPSGTFVYDPVAKTVIYTGASTFTIPDSWKSTNVQVIDNQGATIYGHLSAFHGTTGALDVSTLALSGVLTLKVTETSTLGVQSDGEVNYINGSNATGSVGNWIQDFTTNTNPNNNPE